jgi:hypothetical protein
MVLVAVSIPTLRPLMQRNQSLTGRGTTGTYGLSDISSNRKTREGSGIPQGNDAFSPIPGKQFSTTHDTELGVTSDDKSDNGSGAEILSRGPANHSAQHAPNAITKQTSISVQYSNADQVQVTPNEGGRSWLSGPGSDATVGSHRWL